MKNAVIIPNYLKEKSLEFSKEAKKLLEDNKFSIDQISTAVGYDDASYFSKIFLRKTKMTPSQYRKKILNYTGEEGWLILWREA